MENDKVTMIPFVAHESSMQRMERANKRLWIVIIVMFVCFFIYLMVPNEIADEENTQTVSEIDNSEIHQNIGE